MVRIVRAIQAAVAAATQLGSAEPTTVFNQNMSITEASQGSLAESAKEKIPLLTLVNLWIPLIIVIVGALLFIIGAAGLMVKARKTAA